MIDLSDAPDPRPLPVARRAADESLLRATVLADHAPRRSRVRRRVTTVAVVSMLGLLTVGGVAAAGALLAPRPAVERDTARCYSQVSSVLGDDFPGTSIAHAARPGEAAPEVPPLVIEDCAAAWRVGALTPPGVPARPEGDYPVPPLAACVLPSGQAAVFPGPASTCRSLGLAELDE